jgi:hypothetical protein
MKLTFKVKYIFYYLFQDALEALKEISEFYTQNTLECRRGLRTKIEKRSIALNEVSRFKLFNLNRTYYQYVNWA